MAQTFDIRFDPAGNSFGWKGGGRLSVDSQGMSFALKRGVASLLARQRFRRIPADRIREVYREAETLRVEFATDDDARATLPFRARDRDTAARIVQLLPTLRTIELEQTTATVERRRTGRVPLQLGAIALLGGGALWLVLRPAPEAADAAGASRVPAGVAAEVPQLPVTEDAAITTASRADEPTAPAPAVPGGEPITPDEARKLAILAEDPVDWTRPPPRSGGTAAAARQARFERRIAALPAAESEVEGFVPMEVPDIQVRPEHGVIRIDQTTLAYDTARGMLAAFEAKAADFNENYRHELQRFDRGALDARTFANRLDALEMRWQSLSQGLLADRKYGDPALTGMRGTLLVVVIGQRAFLTDYAAGLRTDDRSRIERAFAALVRAEEAMARARLYVN